MSGQAMACGDAMMRREHEAHGDCWGWPEPNALPTPEQRLGWLRRVGDDAAVDWLAEAEVNAQRSQQCFMENHRARVDDATVTDGDIAFISAWIDGSYPADISDELHVRRRVDKLAEEVGEVIEAVSGTYGENPRKGVTHDRSDIEYETLDVAAAALGAYWSISGGMSPLSALHAHVEHVAARARAKIAEADGPKVDHESSRDPLAPPNKPAEPRMFTKADGDALRKNIEESVAPFVQALRDAAKTLRGE